MTGRYRARRPPADPRAAYAEAAALNPRRADPQHGLLGGPGAPAAAAAMMARCATEVPGGTCGAPMGEHDIGTAGGAPARTRCTRGTADGWCPCKKFTPPVTGGTTDGD